VQAISRITVGVRDMSASIRFYEALGWRRAAQGKYDQTAFFQLQGQILALYPVAELLREQNMEYATPSPGGITLALHVHDKADVWTVYQRFIDAGGRSLRPPAEVPSGAVSCYVADPDGNAWEISWVPQFRIDDDGGLWLP
jgi:catechol 2,3-dioxygenase-like lactoylglutathione lyase family enzyme